MAKSARKHAAANGRAARSKSQPPRAGAGATRRSKSRPAAQPPSVGPKVPRGATPGKRPPLPEAIRAYNAAQSSGDRPICDALAAAIERHLPGAERKIWHRHPVWFLAGNPIVGYHKLKDCVRLLFWSGRSFDEPGLAPEGGFQTAGARYTDVDQVSAKDLQRWLAKSIVIQWDYKNIVKRKGRLERLT